MNRYLLGIDNGGTITKAAIFDTNGKEIAVSSSRVMINAPEPGFAERDMEELWNANIRVIRDLIDKSGINPRLIAGVSITGHGNGLYLIDEDGKPVYKGIYSTDTRAKDIVSSWYKDGLYDRVHPKLMQAIWAGQPVALLSWLKANKPDILSRARWVLMCKDYIRFCLTGKVYAEITDMSGTNLMNVRDIIYDRELLRELGIEDMFDRLPTLRNSSEICGYITAEAAGLTGLEEGTPVAGGLFDIDACAIATGIDNEEKACIIAGTWSINQYITDVPVNSKDIFLNTLYCIDGYRLITEASPTSASNLQWFIERFCGEEERLAKENGISVFDICNNTVSQIEPEENNIIFLPFLFGTNVDSDAKASFIGLSSVHTRANILRSIYEGIVLCHLYHFEKLLTLRQRPEAIRISGGASKSRVWVQIFADALQIPIEVVKGEELGALGAAICAGVATGIFKSFEHAVKDMVEIDYTCHPDPGKKEIYKKKYTAYKAIIKQLEPIWKSL